MKIEKVNDHQIRCTLTRDDLAERQLKLSELAYGTPKAKDLFRDMMTQANLKFGFDAEDIPLMIEAIPLNGDTIVLLITKVEDPEELDTRFSKFAPTIADSEDGLTDLLSELPGVTEDILDLFKKVQNNHLSKLPQGEAPSATGNEAASSEKQIPEVTNITKMVSFNSLNPLINLSSLLDSFYKGDNSLYKNLDNNRYYLVIHQSGHQPDDFNRLCNILLEHGRVERYTSSVEAHFVEHHKMLIKNNAIENLVLLK